MSAASDANIRLGIQLLLIAIEKAPELAALIQRGTSKADLDRLAAADDVAREVLQAQIDASPGLPGDPVPPTEVASPRNHS